jgi:hypothetical protein
MNLRLTRLQIDRAIYYIAYGAKILLDKYLEDKR